MWPKIWTLVAIVATGCRTPGTMPHEMSAEQHEAAAQQHEAAAQQHAQHYESWDIQAQQVCKSPQPHPGYPCWTSIANPTDAHRREAQKHEKIAAEHRAASQALRDAEASACAGIDDYDRDVGPFYHREDIVKVDTLYGRTAKGLPFREGAIVIFRAVPGMTAEWLQRQVDCHLARAAVLGHEVPEMAYCPLMMRGVKATVSSTGNGFAVQIRSDDYNTAQEILARAQKLTSQ